MVYRIFFVSILARTISSCAGAVTAQPPPNVTVPALIIFGDSIMDTGNNNELVTVVKCNFPPYGVDFPGRLPTGRFSNGKIPSDMIAEALGIADQIPPYLETKKNSYDLTKGVSFASAGTGYDPQTALLAV
ncbi:GDSL esterase/lipase At5g42170-like [Andrographis paniculata]|uniref:GDSL esterase/lipase At5g42170-like n=1 Tax=Andrographis paniculata TaxID=175694 RepID=UPI0021E88DDD|nr:GDSL esterase/lipase At5g42170-like [Andrographis paniculata]